MVRYGVVDKKKGQRKSRKAGKVEGAPDEALVECGPEDRKHIKGN